MKNPGNALWWAFEDGCEFRPNGSERIVTMHCEDAGSISLPSGRIVVSDPLLDPWRPPFSTTVLPRSYSVHLALGNDEVALVMVLFKEGRPTIWTRAKPESFSVDSATGCLMDYTAARFLRRKANAGKYNRYSLLLRTPWRRQVCGRTCASTPFLMPTSSYSPPGEGMALSQCSLDTIPMGNSIVW